MTKECELIHPLLSLYLEEDLSARDRLRVARHLNDCADARQELEDYRFQRRALLALPEPEPPADLHDRILSHLNGGPTSADFKTRSRFERPGWSKPGVWGLAAACLGAVLFFSLFSDWHVILRGARKDVLAQAPSAPAPFLDEKTPAENAPTAAGSAAAGSSYEEAESNEAPALSAPAPPPPARRVVRRKASSARRVASVSRPVNPNVQSVALGGNGSDAGLDSSFGTVVKEEAVAKSAEPTTADKSSVTLEKALQAPELAAAAGAPPSAPTTDADRSKVSFGPAAGVITNDEGVRRWSGKDGPYGHEHAEVVGDPISLMAYWQILSGSDPLPPVDFKHEAVAVIFLGTRPTAGYTIQVDGVQEGDSAVTIIWREEPPAPGSTAATESTRPWVMQVIPKSSKPVLFLKKQ